MNTETNSKIFQGYLDEIKINLSGYTPNILLGSDYQAVIIEPRSHKNLESTIKSTMYHLSKSKYKWGLQIFHGNKNEEFVKSLTKDWGNVVFYNVGIDDFTPEEHSTYMETNNFWSNVIGENILIFQTDSLLIRDGIDEFLFYDYVGAPWVKPKEGRYVGNGGLSFRKKKVMIDVCNRYLPSEQIWEDIFFAKHMDYSNVPNVDIAKKFSVEGIFYDKPIGVHKPIKNLTPDQLITILHSS